MELGLFFDMPPRKGQSQASTFDEAFDQIQIAEKGEISSVWVAERHFLPWRSVTSAPTILCSAIAARTERLRVGTAVNVLPLTNPVRLAEEITTLDHICQGRFELGVGRSSGQEAYVGFNVPYTESQSRFSEALDIIQLALTQDSFSYHGRFHSYRDICVVPRPYQKPHPPIRIAITSPESFAKAGSMGLPIFIGLIASPKVMEERLSYYWDAWKQAGHPGQGDVYLRLAVHVGNTSESAVEEPKQSALNFYNNILANQNNSIPGLSVEENRSREKRRSLMANVTYEQILRDHVICGTPDAVTERLLHLKTILRIRGAIIDVNLGGMIPQAHLNNSLRLLSHEVAPNLLNASTGSPSS